MKRWQLGQISHDLLEQTAVMPDKETNGYWWSFCFKTNKYYMELTVHRHFSKFFLLLSSQEIESLQSMACNMLKFFNKQKIIKEFRWKAALVSCGTLQVLQCKCERHKKEKVSGSDGSMCLTPQSSSAQIITSTSQRCIYHAHVTCMTNFALYSMSCNRH